VSKHAADYSLASDLVFQAQTPPVIQFVDVPTPQGHAPSVHAAMSGGRWGLKNDMVVLAGVAAGCILLPALLS